MKRALWVLVPVLLLVLLLPLLNAFAKDDPGKVAQKWLDAVKAEDLSKASEYVVTAGRRLFEEGENGQSDGGFSNVVLGEVSIKENTAEVKVRGYEASTAGIPEEAVALMGDATVEAILLAREEEQWRVSGTKMRIRGAEVPMLFTMFLGVSDAVTEGMEEMVQSLTEQMQNNPQMNFHVQ